MTEPLNLPTITDRLDIAKHASSYVLPTELTGWIAPVALIYGDPEPSLKLARRAWFIHYRDSKRHWVLSDDGSFETGSKNSKGFADPITPVKMLQELSRERHRKVAIENKRLEQLREREQSELNRARFDLANGLASLVRRREAELSRSGGDNAIRRRVLARYERDTLAS